MNADNQRLLEIKRFKQGYANLMDNSGSIDEILEYKSKIEELEKEEKEILGRCDVRI